MILLTPRRRSGENGSAMVEGALILALFILIVYGFVQIAFVLFGYNNLTYASRVAMRYAVIHGSTATYTCTTTDIQNMITPLLWGAPASGTTVITNWNPNNSPGSAVSISVTVKYNSVIPFTSLHNFTIGTTAYGVVIQ
jgi:Flp pilus assembly protein TadG